MISISTTVAAVRLTLYAFISSIEIDVRNFFISNINENNEKILLDEELITKLKMRSSKEGYFSEDSTNLIEYLDFGDCISILNKYKKLLPKSLHENVMNVSSKLNTITQIRNRVMHSRPLEYDDFPTVVDFVNSIHLMDLISWDSTLDIKEKINKDPSIIFELKIPKIDNYSDDKILHNLPPAEFDDTGFIGREMDRRNIKNKIYGNYPVITIVGDGGIGKTALLLRCLYDIIDDSTQSFDAIIWVSLKTRILNNGEFKNIQNSISSVLEMFKVISVNLVGQQTIITEKIDDYVNEILDYMRNFNILLVLDNLETINSEAIRDFLSEIPNGSKVITTSRIGIGEFESRHILEGFTDKESVYYLRRLAQNFQLAHILKLPELEQIKLCRDLYSSPLAIKWFLLNILKGEPMEEILRHKEDLTNFCMSNVYDKLSEINKKVLETLQIIGKKCTDAELDYLLGLDSIQHRKSLNELVSTNMVKMESFTENNTLKSYFYITEFAREYLNRHSKPNNTSFIRVNKKIKQLKGLTENLSIETDFNQYDVTSIVTSNENEKIAAYYLRQALISSDREDFSTAFSLLEKAKSAVPDYYQVYRVSGFIHGENRDLFNADIEYKTAIEINSNSASLYYSYSEFKLILMDDPDEALELTLKAEILDPSSFEIKLQKARILKRLTKFEEAEHIFNLIIDNLDSIKHKLKRITIDQSADNYKRWGEFLVVHQNLTEAVLKFEKAINRISLLDTNDLDSKIVITISKILSATQPTCVFLDMEYRPGIDLYIFILEKFCKNISGSPRYDFIKRNIQSMYPHFSAATIDKIESLLIEDIRALARKVTSDSEGYVHIKNKGFGFILNKTFNKGLFFYWKNSITNFADLKEGDKVRFDISSNDKGPCAVNVTFIDIFTK